MKRVFGRFGRWVRSSKHTPNAIMAVCSVVISSLIVLNGYGLSPHTSQTSTITAGDEYITFSPDTPGGSTAQTTVATKPVIASHKSLIISPAAISIKAGETLNGLTINADDYTAISMPTFSAGPINGLQLNFTASPAKTTWAGSLTVAKFAAPGSYSFEISAQANRTTFYTNTITLTVVPTPTMVVSLLPVDYDYATDSRVYILRLNRLNGYDQPVTRLTGQYTADSLVLTCTFQPTDANTYTVTCGNVSIASPTNGTLMVSVSTTSDVFTSAADFSLPPL